MIIFGRHQMYWLTDHPDRLLVLISVRPTFSELCRVQSFNLGGAYHGVFSGN